MGNAGSLENKVDEMTALEGRKISRESFTETWLQDSMSDTCISTDSGLVMYVNGWCHTGHVTVKESFARTLTCWR
ncbi:hypothetical protein EXN66_Car012873 [Channa argus]|uniref:Uncharacterized protein n=1 Tax=Channa argus TaxID=215402 RepID=A0A6G1Q4A5_CHAAH|nr:hypothetical protein EXN66_Car012873 [Channa argus]